MLRCRVLYSVALEQRILLYRQRGVSLSRYQQEAELIAIRAEMPEYAAIHSHAAQDVLARLDTTYHAFFRRVQMGQTPGFPHYQGRTRYHSFTYKTALVRQYDTIYLENLRVANMIRNRHLDALLERHALHATQQRRPA